jgi:outer membrane protein TolC
LLRSYTEAVARARVLERAADAAERAYEIARKRFEAGNIDSQRLLQEQAAQRQAATDQLNAIIDVHLMLAALERAVRQPLTLADGNADGNTRSTLPGGSAQE